MERGFGLQLLRVCTMATAATARLPSSANLDDSESWKILVTRVKRIRLSENIHAAMARSVAVAGLRRGACFRLSLRLDPVRADPDAARRHRRHPRHRLRQYRRDQRAAHRPQGARRGD